MSTNARVVLLNCPICLLKTIVVQGVNNLIVYKVDIMKLLFLFGLRPYVPVNKFSIMSARFPGLNQC